LRLAIKISFSLGLAILQASPLNDIGLLMHTKKMSIYGVKNQDNNNTTHGLGLFYNTQNLKVKAEQSDSFFKTGAMIQTNPLQSPMYVNIGGNYLDEKNSDNNFNQYSGAFAIGYNLNNDLYVEAGKNITKLTGSSMSEDAPIHDSISKETYIHLGKRFNTPIGTIDTQMKGSEIYNTLATKQENYESNVNYYLNDALKVGYFYSMNQNDIASGYSIDLSYLTSQYTKDITQDSYNITFGLKANFTDITKLSTYKPTSKVKKKLSKSKKFDDIILQKNMHLQK
jgi:hypothetical protein